MKPSKPSFFFILIAFIILSFSASAQSSGMRYGIYQVRRFKTPEDSLKLVAVQQRIDDVISKKPIRQKMLDSLMESQRVLFMRAYNVTIYNPSREFTNSDSLLKLSDFEGITQVTVYRKNKIPADVLKCKDLVSLELVNCTLDRLPDQLSALKNLRSLYVYNNQSKKHLKLFDNESITYLSIKGESAAAVPKSFKKFRGLERLDLSENRLTRFPNGARHNTRLKELGLQRNELTLRNKMKKHVHLERLGLQNNYIEYVPASIKNFPNLKKLNFNINKIDRVHNAIGSLQELEFISFYSNSLTSIPDGVYKLPNLLEIDLFHNQIESIKPAFATWKKMTTLYLSHNKITELPENLDTLKNLSGLYVWDNRLGKLPESIRNMTNLKFIRVNNNYLKNLPAGIAQLPLMEELDISHNYIEEVPPQIFDYPNLKILALVNNPWNQVTIEMLPSKVEEARKKGVFVHVSERD